MGNNTQVRWVSSRPELVVSAEGSTQYGRCYSGTTYKVTSRQRVTSATLRQMFLLGFFGGGQEFNILSPCDGKEAELVDFVSPLVFDKVTGKVIEGMPAVNEYTHKEYEDIKMSYFEYRVERRVDSGD